MQLRKKSLHLVCGCFVMLGVAVEGPSAIASQVRGGTAVPADMLQPESPVSQTAEVRRWHLDKKGTIFDSHHRPMGRIEGDGTVDAQNGVTVGHISRDIFTDKGGQVRATLSEDGALYNAMGMIIAWVSPHDRIAAAFIIFSPQLIAQRTEERG